MRYILYYYPVQRNSLGKVTKAEFPTFVVHIDSSKHIASMSSTTVLPLSIGLFFENVGRFFELQLVTDLVSFYNLFSETVDRKA